MTSVGTACLQLHGALNLIMKNKADREMYTATTVGFLQNMLMYHGRPGAYWDYVSNGCFKEVYTPGRTAPFVLKFVSKYNQTAEEESLLSLAKDEGLAHFFVPTYFIPLPDEVIAQYLDDVMDYEDFMSSAEYSSYEHSETYQPHPMTLLQVQPKVVPNTDFTILKQSAIREQYFCDVNGEIVDPKTMERLVYYIYSEAWIHSLLETYCIAEIERFVDFLENYCVSDLHGGNLGYLNGKPVILDSMSRSLT